MAITYALAALAVAALVPGGYAATCVPRPVKTTECAGETYVYEQLAGAGILPGNGRDKYGDTLAGIGSAIVIEKGSWELHGDGSYSGLLWGLPDRGWNTEGTLNFQPRVHKFDIKFTPSPGATVANPSAPNLIISYKDTILLTGPDGQPCTGLDPTGILTYPGFPHLPAATYVGDGFGGAGDGGTRVSVDAEGLIVDEDGWFWVSDEYGPYVYLFNGDGRMQTAIRPPDAIIPMRNGSESFSANSPPRYLGPDAGNVVIPEEPQTGRVNNRGFEGLGVSEDGKSLWALLQSATVQEGGEKKKSSRHARLLKYDISSKLSPVYSAEYVLPLPLYLDINDENSEKAAAQSEVYALPNGQFLVLARDSNAGAGPALEFKQSSYRQIDVYDISKATDVKGAAYDCATCAFASTKGVLKEGVTPATLCPWIDLNQNKQLGRFGLHNGGADDSGLLNEKWEAIAVVPADPGNKNDKTYYIFAVSDNDFITQDGAMNFGRMPYADASGGEIANQALVFKVKLPF